MWSRRTQGSDPEVAEEPEGDTVDAPPIATASQQLTATMATRAWSILLATCLILGPIGAAVGLYAVLTRPPDAAAAPMPDEAAADDRVVVGEFAVRVVVAWLTATQDRPGELLGLVHQAQPPTLPRTAFTVAAPSVSRIERDTDGNWSVTVSATVTDARRTTARRYYQVPIAEEGGTLTALTLPAPISGPAIGAASGSAYRTELAVSSAAGATVAQFLAAYLAGNGDVARYVTPGITLTALQPAPYSTIRLDELRTTTDDLDEKTGPADGQRIHVLATATATVNAQQSCTLTYALTLAGRGGRWEINAIDPTPAVPGPDTDGLPADGDPSNAAPTQHPSTPTIR